MAVSASTLPNIDNAENPKYNFLSFGMIGRRVPSDASIGSQVFWKLARRVRDSVVGGGWKGRGVSGVMVPLEHRSGV